MMACATGARAEAERVPDAPDAGSARVRAREWVNLTVYHVNQANYSAGDIGNMNTADTLGDLEFTGQSRTGLAARWRARPRPRVQSRASLRAPCLQQHVAMGLGVCMEHAAVCVGGRCGLRDIAAPCPRGRVC